jgi:hypothetical protein
MFLNSNLEILVFVCHKSNHKDTHLLKMIFQNSNFAILYCEHILVYSLRLHGSNTNRNIITHAGGPHWPEQGAQIDIALIVGGD